MGDVGDPPGGLGKLLKPYLQRAEEMDVADPRVAYFCRLYALQKAIESGGADESDDTREYLGVLMTRLEADKGVVPDLGEDDRGYMEAFAVRVFSGADSAYRAGTHTGQTAVSFFAASVFLEALGQFEGGDEPPLDPKFAEMRRYALVKAAEIRKAVLAGQLSAGPRPPAPGAGARGRGGPSGGRTLPPAVEDGEAGLDPADPAGPTREWTELAKQGGGAGASLPSTSGSIVGPVFHLERPRGGLPDLPAAAPAAQPEAPRWQEPPPLPRTAPVSAARTTPSGGGGGAGTGTGVGIGHEHAAGDAAAPAEAAAAPPPSRRAPLTRTQEDMCLEAQKLARFAVSALQFDDVNNARSYLQQALSALPPPT